MSAPRRPRSRHEFEIAVICALRIESDAVEALFDEDWEEDQKYQKAQHDPNEYSMGRIGNHNIVLAFMPGMGKGNSASVAAYFRSSFNGIKLCLVVGVCGGVPFGPNGATNIFLGDIIISTGVVQYDFGRQLSNTIVRKDTLEGSLGRPNHEIRSFLNKLEGQRARTRLRDRTSAHLGKLFENEHFKGWKYPGVEDDRLYKPTYRHMHHEPTSCSICHKCANKDDEVCQDALNSTCDTLGCHAFDAGSNVLRARSTENTNVPKPGIHFGRVASGDLVMKSSHRRDEIAVEEQVIAFEMEGAGVWDNIPTVVIKVVCDYADSHKGDQWQKYAAASAAACMKGFLKEWRRTDRTWQPEVEPESESTPSRVCKLVDNAYKHLDTPGNKFTKKDLEAALPLLQEALDESSTLQPSFARRIYTGLIDVEKKLSCCRNLEFTGRMKHIQEAEKHCKAMTQVVCGMSDNGALIQVRLERSIVKGIRAELEFEQGGGDMGNITRFNVEAVKGIEEELEALETVDPGKFKENVHVASWWHEHFTRKSYYY